MYFKMHNIVSSLFIIAITSLTLCSTVHGIELDEFLRRNYEIKDFFEYIRRNEYLNASMKFMPGTIFAPKNDALNIFKAEKTIKDKIILYHYCNSGYNFKDLESKGVVTSAIAGNTPLYITRKGYGVFVNNAEITRRTDDLYFDVGKYKQYVHIIDQVLEPTLKRDDDHGIDNPNAKDFIEQPIHYDVIGSYRINKFTEQVKRRGKIGLYTNFTKATYFIPIDRAFSALSADKLEERVLEGHVIPDHAIFLRTAELGHPVEAYRPTEFQANAPILITFKKDIGTSDNYKDMWFVNSDNRQTDPKYHKGVVQAEIVRGNIVLRNGVVHLLSKPLVLIDTNVFETFEWYSTKQVWSMKDFFNFARQYESSAHLFHQLKNPNEAVTLFVPSDKAMRDSEILKSLTFRQNTTAILDIIRSHVVHGGISTLEISEALKKNKHHKGDPFQVPTLVKGRKLLFSMVVDEDLKRTFHVEGFGANATILQPDIGATNGFIHIIDRVLGIPDLNIQQKLGNNPLLHLTNKLWKKEKIESILNNTQEPFTIFAPSEKAWIELSNKKPAGASAYDGLFFGNPGDVPQKLFKRLIIMDHAYTIEDLNELSKVIPAVDPRFQNTINWTEQKQQFPNYSLQTIEGNLKVNKTTSKVNYGGTIGSHDEDRYFVYFKNMKALVIRPNIRCTNGYIHVIDGLFLDEQEIAVAKAGKQFYSLIGILSCSLVTVFAKYIFLVK